MRRPARRFDASFEFLVGGLLALVDAFQVGDELGGHPAAGLARLIPGADLG